jgi:hypothetical protein
MYGDAEHTAFARIRNLCLRASGSRNGTLQAANHFGLGVRENAAGYPAAG